jgi:hypothetical protein
VSGEKQVLEVKEVLVVSLCTRQSVSSTTVARTLFYKVQMAMNPILTSHHYTSGVASSYWTTLPHTTKLLSAPHQHCYLPHQFYYANASNHDGQTKTR